MRWKILIGVTVAVLISTLLWILLLPTVTIGPLEIR
jgi:hypothetical protein